MDLDALYAKFFARTSGHEWRGGNMTDLVSCKSCVYWHPPDPMGGSTVGQCRRRPPRGGGSPNANRFPLTTANAWCGAWEGRDGETFEGMTQGAEEEAT